MTKKKNYLFAGEKVKVGTLPYYKRGDEGWNTSMMNVPITPRKWVELDTKERKLVEKYEKKTGKEAFQEANDYMFGNYAWEWRREKKGFMQWRIMEEMKSNPKLLNQISSNVLVVLSKQQLSGIAKKQKVKVSGSKEDLIDRIMKSINKKKKGKK